MHEQKKKSCQSHCCFIMTNFPVSYKETSVTFHFYLRKSLGQVHVTQQLICHHFPQFTSLICYSMSRWLKDANIETCCLITKFRTSSWRNLNVPLCPDPKHLQPSLLNTQTPLQIHPRNHCKFLFVCTQKLFDNGSNSINYLKPKCKDFNLILGKYDVSV